MGGYKGEWSFGLALTNMGSKVSYTRDNVVKDFIPINMGLGSALRLDLDQYNSLTFALDFNKLMIPTPIAAQIKDDNGNDVPNPEYDCCPKKNSRLQREITFFWNARIFRRCAGWI
ncbi:MAG: hypothetical protein IPO48_02190 [Saprospiraceae bacterium]|nr:hypothetical protein [Saprospiraceae bacterium]